MVTLARRRFCGTAILAFPLLCCALRVVTICSISRMPFWTFWQTKLPGLRQTGCRMASRLSTFGALCRSHGTFDARLEEKGTNRELKGRLDDDDFHRPNPSLTAQKTADYWHKHGVHLNKDDLTARLTMDSTAYREMKKNIKKLGGVRALHASIADAFEQKAKEFETAAFRGSAIARNDRIAFIRSGRSRSAEFIPVQLDLSMLVGANLDCLCRAMVVEGALLALVCLAGCAPCCAQGAFPWL